MNWLNLSIATLTSDTYLGCTPTERATWINLMRYCAQQENGGRITGCGKWKDRKWQQVAGVTEAEVKAECDLWAWEDGGIRVAFYPVDQERIIQAQREAGRDRQRKRRAQSKSSPHTPLLKGKEKKGLPPRSPSRSPFRSAGSSPASSPQIDFPPGFPETPEKAKNECINSGVPPEKAEEYWLEAAGRGGLDWAGRAITRFANHASGRWARDKGGKAQQRHNAKPPAGESRELKEPKIEFPKIEL